MVTVADLVAAGKDLGIFQFYLPFVIMFAIVYGLLRKSKIFGDPQDAKAINMIIALAASLFIMIYPTTGTVIIGLADFLSNFFAGTLMIVVTMIAFLIMMYIVVGGLTQGEGPKFDVGTAAKWTALGVGILVIGTFIASGGLAAFPGLAFGNIISIPTPFFGFLTIQDMAIVVIVVITGVVIYWLSRGGEKSAVPEAAPNR
jgi:hypothetical protein